MTMKLLRCFGFVLCIAFFLSICPVYSAPFHDFPCDGILPVVAERVTTPPEVDGVASPSEYKRITEVSFGEGLYGSAFQAEGSRIDCTQTALSLEPDLSEVKQINRIAYDREWIYICLSLDLGTSISPAPYEHPLYGSVYAVSFSVSLGSDLVSRTAYLTNQYYFSAADLRCIGMNGMRWRMSENGSKSLLTSFSSSSETGQLYTDDTGSVWNSECYASHAALSLAAKNEVTLEAAIPLGDLLRLLSSADQETAQERLESGEGNLIGGFLSQFSVWNRENFPGMSQPFSFQYGIPLDASFEDPDENVSWREWLSEQSRDSSLIRNLAAIPAEFYLVGEPPEETKPPSEVVPPSEENSGGIPGTAEGSAPSDTSDETGDLLENLPTLDSSQLGEEIQYDEEAEESSKLFDSWWAMGMALVLFVAVSALLLFFKPDKKETETHSSKRERRK